MNDLKIKPVKIMLDRERNLIMDLNALEELEDLYEDWPTIYKPGAKEGEKIAITDPLEKALESLSHSVKKIKHIKNFLYAGLVYEDPSLTPKKIGSMLSLRRIDEIADQIWLAISQGMPKASDTEPTAGEA